MARKPTSEKPKQLIEVLQQIHNSESGRISRVNSVASMFILKRLAKDGFLEYYEDDGGVTNRRGRTPKFFRLTEKGIQALAS